MNRHTYPPSGGLPAVLRGTTLAVAVTCAVFAATASAQTGHEGHSHGPTGPTRMVVTTDAAGAPVAVDRETGKARSLTRAEAQVLFDGLKSILNRSADGLTVVQRADGSYSIDLEGRFQNAMIAKRDENGALTIACVDTPEAAAAFFDIDPALIGLVAGGTPVRTAPTKPLEVR